MMTYRVVTTDVPDGALWRSREVTRTTDRDRALRALWRLDAKGAPRAIQFRLFKSEPWRFFSERECLSMISERAPVRRHT